MAVVHLTEVIVSGGDLGDFFCPVACARSHVNWVADALGCAPKPGEN